jgi:hypothetical protein
MKIENAGSGSSNTSINYPIPKMRQTAGNIMSNANNSLAQHETAWSKLQQYIGRFPGFMQEPIRAVLSAYENRLRASYQWQIDYAQALSTSADTMDDADTSISDSFQHHQ